VSTAPFPPRSLKIANALIDGPQRLGVPMFLKTGTVENASPEAFEVAAPRCPVLRVEAGEGIV
jgi:hypothetical protein